MVAQLKIDEVDVKILKTLLDDARSSFTDIAQDCGISTNAIVKRFYRLKKSGVITGTALRVNIKSFGYVYRITIDLNVSGGKESNVIEALKKIPAFVVGYQVVGKYDIHAVVYIKNIEQIEHIREMIRKQEGINRIGLTATYEGGLFTKNLEIKPTEAAKIG